MLERFIERTGYDSYRDFKENYHLHYDDDFNFATHVVDAWAEEEPDKLALVWCDDHGRQRTFTFSQMARLSRQAAGWLRSQGIGRGDRVMVILKKHWTYWVTAVALHRLGAVLIPASYLLTAKDIAYRLDAADVKLLIAIDDPFVVEQVEEARRDGARACPLALADGIRPGWADYCAGVEQSPDDYVIYPDHHVRDQMLIYFTSGTTGMPKMVVHDFSYPLGHIVTAKYWQQVQNGGLHLTGVDSGWAKFGWGCIYGQWLAGSAMLGYDGDNKFSARRMIEVIRTYRPTTVCVPGTIYRFMMKEGLTREDFSSVRHCCSAGEPLSPEIIKDFRDLTGLTLHEGYGQSEGSVLVANFPWFAPRPGSAGKPSPLYDIALVDARGNPCKAGEEGELVIRNLDKFYPECLLRGYWADGKLVPPYDEHYVYHTGDMMWMDEDGYYWFIGRNDDIIKCSAYRIGPFEIESVLLTHPAVYECAITGAPDPLRGQVVKATIVLAPGTTGDDALTKELQSYVKRLTAPYKYPRVVEYVDALPKTTSGKIIRKHIRNSAPPAGASGSPEKAATDALEFRTACPDDAQRLLDYLRAVGGESDFLTFGRDGLDLSVEAERAAVGSAAAAPSVMLVAVSGDEIISVGSVRAGRGRTAHRGELGITVRKAWWGKGVGRRMMNLLQDRAKENGLEMITLTVAAENRRAAALYQSLGYRETGRFPRMLKVGKGRYLDALLMHLDL